MTPQDFYEKLGQCYREGDPEKTEAFLTDILGRMELDRNQCSNCGPRSGEYQPKLMIAVLNEAASFYRGRSQWEYCLSLYDKLIFELNRYQQKHTVNYAVARMNQASAYRMKGDMETAEKYFSQAEEMLDELNCHDPYIRSTLYNNRAPVFLRKGDPGRALADLKKALESLRAMEHTGQDQAITLASISQILLQTGEEDEGEKAADEAMAVLETEGESEHSGAVLNAKATLLCRKGEYGRAAELYGQAAEITRKYFGENAEYRVCVENRKKAEAIAGKHLP